MGNLLPPLVAEPNAAFFGGSVNDSLMTLNDKYTLSFKWNPESQTRHTDRQKQSLKNGHSSVKSYILQQTLRYAT